MSISGDTVIMRNGRSTSQVSIYNYPEHLNPFYEEDQHKRLRFWHINKKNDNDRWKSISITSLKDIWPLKSFRLSKKKSSTLGINKTSESPPLLRRDDYTFGSPLNRNSLQNVHAAKRATSMGFERNDQYRSTIQVMGVNQTLPHQKRYIYTRSFTPQPQRTFLTETPTLTRRSGSRTSTTSTNPFEESDDEYYDDSISYAGQNFSRGHLQTQSLTPAQRKQKRRAPIPAALIKNDQIELPKTSHEQTELRIEEDEDLSISNLSSQIQTFVDTSLSKDTTTVVTSTPIKCNGTPKIIVEHVTTESEPPIVSTTTTTIDRKMDEAKNEKAIIEQEAKEEPKKEKSSAEKESLKAISKSLPEKNEEVKRSSSETVTIRTPFILTTPPTPEFCENLEPSDISLEQPELREIAVLGRLIGPEKPKRSSLTKRTVQFIEMEQKASQENNFIVAKEPDTTVEKLPLEPMQKADNVELKKVEEWPATTITTTTTTITNFSNTVDPLKIIEPVEAVGISQEEPSKVSSTKIATVESTGAIPRTLRDWKTSTLAPLPVSVPLEKRKTAKEIIESINRQQRLLKEAAERNLPDTRNSINQRLTGVITYNYYAQTATNSNDKITNDLDKQNKRVQLPNGHKHYGECDVDNADNTNNSPNDTYGQDAQKLQNGSPVFAKCRVYKENYPQRESSPTTSNLDWNPLPKPKRNKDINLD